MLLKILPMQKFFFSATALLVTLLIGAPARSQETRNTTFAQCQQGMQQVTQNAPKLQPVVKFFQERAKLAKVVDGEIFAEEGGEKGTHFWVIVLDEAEQAKYNVPVAFQFDQTQDLFYLPAAPISQPWMGLGCLHETVHAKDILEGKESRDASRQDFLAGEVRAYEMELAALDAFTEGRFTTTLQTILERQNYRRSGNLTVPNQAAQKALDNLFPQPEPQSTAERSVRDGLYLIALNFARLPNQQERLLWLEKLYPAEP